MYAKHAYTWISRARRNDCPSQDDILKLIFLYMELFYYLLCKLDFNVFLNFQIQNYCIILSSCTEINCRGANAVHRMTSLDGNVFPNTLPMWGESTGHQWILRTKGKWYKGVFVSVWFLLPGSFCTRELLVFLQHASKEYPLANDKLTVV